jgi:hypothetical protein
MDTRIMKSLYRAGIVKRDQTEDDAGHPERSPTGVLAVAERRRLSTSALCMPKLSRHTRTTFISQSFHDPLRKLQPLGTASRLTLERKIAMSKPVAVAPPMMSQCWATWRNNAGSPARQATSRSSGASPTVTKGLQREDKAAARKQRGKTGE